MFHFDLTDGERTFVAVDASGNETRCRAVLSFEKDGKFYLVFTPAADEPLTVDSPLTLACCDDPDFASGGTAVFRPVAQEEQAQVLQEAFQDMVRQYAHIANLTQTAEDAALYFDDGGFLDDDDADDDEPHYIS